VPGPAPTCHARPRTWPSTRTSRRTCPNVNERKNAPSVDGAIAKCPRIASVFPARSTSQSSMQSAPSSIACIWGKDNPADRAVAGDHRAPPKLAACRTRNLTINASRHLSEKRDGDPYPGVRSHAVRSCIVYPAF
jgi:hypothetical protein